VAFLGAVLGLVVTLGGLGAALWAFQDRLIYFPDPTPPPPPALLGLDRVAETRLRTADGLDILAWNLPAGRGDAPVLLYLHGNGGSLAYRADRLRRFERLGWGALALALALAVPAPLQQWQPRQHLQQLLQPPPLPFVPLASAPW
jgi:hypothetical protein